MIDYIFKEQLNKDGTIKKVINGKLSNSGNSFECIIDDYNSNGGGNSSAYFKLEISNDSGQVEHGRLETIGQWERDELKEILKIVLDNL